MKAIPISCQNSQISVASKKYRLVLLFVLFIISGLSCERYEPTDVSTVDCAECYQDKPEWLPLNIKVNFNGENPFVPIQIFKGDREDNVLDYADTAFQEDYWVDVHPGQYYSVEARYKLGSSTILVIDGDKIKAAYTTSDCDQPCYYKSGGYIDVRLLSKK